MEAYEIFKSEGGFRFAGETYAGGPVIDKSPWFPTKKAAEKAAIKARAKEQDWIAQEKARIGI